MVYKRGVPTDWVASANYIVDVDSEVVEKNRYNKSREEILDKKDKLLLCDGNKRTMFCPKESKDSYIDILEEYIRKIPSNLGLYTYIVSCDNQNYIYQGEGMWKVEEIDNESL